MRQIKDILRLAFSASARWSCSGAAKGPSPPSRLMNHKALATMPWFTDRSPDSRRRKVERVTEAERVIRKTQARINQLLRILPGGSASRADLLMMSMSTSTLLSPSRIW